MTKMKFNRELPNLCAFSNINGDYDRLAGILDRADRLNSEMNVVYSLGNLIHDRRDFPIKPNFFQRAINSGRLKRMLKDDVHCLKYVETERRTHGKLYFNIVLGNNEKWYLDGMENLTNSEIKLPAINISSPNYSYLINPECNETYEFIYDSFTKYGIMERTISCHMDLETRLGIASDIVLEGKHHGKIPLICFVGAWPQQEMIEVNKDGYSKQVKVNRRSAVLDFNNNSTYVVGVSNNYRNGKDLVNNGYVTLSKDTIFFHE